MGKNEARMGVEMIPILALYISAKVAVAAAMVGFCLVLLGLFLMRKDK